MICNLCLLLIFVGLLAVLTLPGQDETTATVVIPGLATTATAATTVVPVPGHAAVITGLLAPALPTEPAVSSTMITIILMMILLLSRRQ